MPVQTRSMTRKQAQAPVEEEVLVEEVHVEEDLVEEDPAIRETNEQKIRTLKCFIYSLLAQIEDIRKNKKRNEILMTSKMVALTIECEGYLKAIQGNRSERMLRMEIFGKISELKSNLINSAWYEETVIVWHLENIFLGTVGDSDSESESE